MISKTDLKEIISLLEKSSKLIDVNCMKANEKDVARRCKVMRDKIEKRLKLKVMDIS